MRAPQRPQRGEEQERAPSARLENGQRRLDHRLRECRVIRVERQALGNVEQRLVREVERACPAARLGFGHAELAGEMLEILADGQGGGSEDPGARVVHHLPPEQLRGRKRRDVQLCRVPVDFHPAHLGLAFALAHARKNRHRAPGSARAGSESLRALGLLCKRPLQLLEGSLQLFKRAGEIRQPQCLRPGEARAGLAERQAQVAGGLVEPRRYPVELGRRAAGGPQLETGVARQLGQLRGRYAFAEEHARRLGQLVRLVENESVAGRQQLGDAFVAQHHVGEEQVMIHHHQVRRERVPARAHHEAVPVVGTLLPEAVVARRRGVRPDRRVLGDVGQVGAIAGRGHGGKALDAMQLRNFLPRGEAAFARRALHAVEAYIVRASLQ